MPHLGIRGLIEEQRKRADSGDVAERFAAALLLPGVLAARLRELSDFHLGQVLEHEVCSNLSVLAPELTVCMAAAERLCNRQTVRFLIRRRSRALQNEGEHILHAEAALSRGALSASTASVPEGQVREQHLHDAMRAQSENCLRRAGFREMDGFAGSVALAGRSGRKFCDA